MACVGGGGGTAGLSISLERKVDEIYYRPNKILSMRSTIVEEMCRN